MDKVLKKYRLLDTGGGNIEGLNAELRSKYSIDLSASVEEMESIVSLAAAQEPAANAFASTPQIPHLNMQHALLQLPQTEPKCESARGSQQAYQPQDSAASPSTTPATSRPEDFAGYAGFHVEMKEEGRRHNDYLAQGYAVSAPHSGRTRSLDPAMEYSTRMQYWAGEAGTHIKTHNTHNTQYTHLAGTHIQTHRAGTHMKPHNSQLVSAEQSLAKIEQVSLMSHVSYI